MRRLEMTDIRPLAEYETLRKDFRSRIMDLKKRRRIHLGNRISLVFENRETILFQIQEMMRTEHLLDAASIQGELDAYNPLIAQTGELSATLFIEITDLKEIRETLDRLRGIDNGQSLFMELGKNRIWGRFEEGHSNEEKLSAVHYIRFHFSPDQREEFKDASVPAALVIEHPAYRARTVLGGEVRRELVEDME